MTVATLRWLSLAFVLAPLLGRGTGEPMRSPGELLYEYYWEYAFPHTPTTFALRGDRYKYIYYDGIWDTSELYDVVADPDERHNLIDVPGLRDTVRVMRNRLFDRLEATGGMQIPERRGDWQAGSGSHTE
jgi:hypothetical protein